MRLFSPLAFVLFAIAAPAYGQATRTWVSGVGDDANPCSRTAPCKTFAGAISKTAANGEINVLDSGGFGAVTITKSITIDGGGAQASILAANANGIAVNGAGITVSLRNLSINGAGTPNGNGIRIINAAAVSIDNVAVMNFSGAGPTTGRGLVIETSTADARVTIANSSFYNMGFFAIHSVPPGGNVVLDVDNVRIAKGGATGIQLRKDTNAVISNCSITNNAVGAGVTLELSTVSAHISNCVLANNAYGVFNGFAGGTPTARLYQNVITGNTLQGLLINGGQVISFGNNAIRGNAGNEAPTQTIVAQ